MANCIVCLKVQKHHSYILSTNSMFLGLNTSFVLKVLPRINTSVFEYTKILNALKNVSFEEKKEIERECDAYLNKADHSAIGAEH